ncbi:Aldo-keto reductase [Operophtera brumata]|uniref:Aldo-keto reductase n=1 Tax=Operophtera brumata TaxID=104452 RepID=A0A0L7L3L5_OPEBR|nr:Aldo-keto reductase [Operophtera brumata]
MSRVPVTTYSNGKTIPVLGLGTWKLWNTFHRPDLVRGALLETLKNLNVDYVDLYLIHWPQAYKVYQLPIPSSYTRSSTPTWTTWTPGRRWSHSSLRVSLAGIPAAYSIIIHKIQYSDVDYVDTWKALEPLLTEGLTRRYTSCLFHHHTQDPRRLKEYCEARGIKVTAYSPLGSPDRPWAQPGDPQLMEDPKLKAIADRLKKTVAQVLIRFSHFKLSQEDMDLIDSFDCNGRLVPMTASLGHKFHPFENEEF